MTGRLFATVAGTVFGIITLLHGLRLIFGWEAVIGGWMVPHWVSWIAIFLFGGLAYAALKLRH